MASVPVVIYESPTCPYCRLAKTLLTKKSVAFDAIEVNSQAIYDEMIARAGGRTSVPQIFIGETHVGGYDDLAELDSLDELDPLLGRPEPD